MYNIWVAYTAWLKGKHSSLVVWIKNYLKRPPVHCQCFTLLTELRNPDTIRHTVLFKNTLGINDVMFNYLVYRVTLMIERQAKEIQARNLSKRKNECLSPLPDPGFILPAATKPIPSVGFKWFQNCCGDVCCNNRGIQAGCDGFPFTRAWVAEDRQPIWRTVELSTHAGDDWREAHPNSETRQLGFNLLYL